MTLATAVYGVGIKSIQAGTITINSNTTSNTATISSVSTAKSFVLYGGNSGGDSSGGGNPSSDAGHVVLTNATTVTATRLGVGNNMILAYTVVEFN
jgi:hypothetical protein